VPAASSRTGRYTPDRVARLDDCAQRPLYRLDSARLRQIDTAGTPWLRFSVESREFMHPTKTEKISFA
jgi:hypothetical protein